MGAGTAIGAPIIAAELVAQLTGNPEKGWFGSEGPVQGISGSEGGIASGEGKSGMLRCIIVTACTGRNSPEVEIARKYRDRFLDADQLRGYYALAEMVVPVLERNKKARQNVKKWLVDRLIDYGEYRIGLKQRKPLWSSVAVSKVFLATIKAIGMILPEYVRANGEVY
jgi:hypothetical protein